MTKQPAGRRKRRISRSLLGQTTRDRCRSPRRRRLGLEQLEDRRLLAIGAWAESRPGDCAPAAIATGSDGTLTPAKDSSEIRGGKFDDLDADGRWDPAEPGLEGWTIYLDLDEDGQLDHGEPSATTGADGRYVLGGLAPGLYSVAEVPQDDWEQTTPTWIERASLAQDGSQGNRESTGPELSGDGRYVAFTSTASNLVPGDTNGMADAFVFNRWTKALECVSVAPDGSVGDYFSDSACLSADGRYAAFRSAASNLVPGDSGWGHDVFVRDLHAGTTELVSHTPGGGPGNATSLEPSLSADARYVAFSSYAWDLVPGHTNRAYDIFVHDRQTGAMECLSMGYDGTDGNGDSHDPRLSADGRYVLFWSDASNLVPGDTNGQRDIFLFDRQTRAMRCLSVAPDGSPGNGGSSYPCLSGDGRYATFTSNASNLVPGGRSGVGRSEASVCMADGASFGWDWLYELDFAAGSQRHLRPSRWRASVTGAALAALAE